MTTAIVVLLLILLIVDWRQTLRIFATGRRELNPAIRWLHRRYGARGVDAWFSGWMAIALLLAAFWQWAVYALAAAAVVQLAVVVRNHRLGIRP